MKRLARSTAVEPAVEPAAEPAVEPAAEQHHVAAPHSAVPRAVGMLLAAGFVLYVAWLLLLPGTPSDPRDEWLRGLLIAGCAGAAATRAIRSPIDRAAWAVMTLAILSWLCGSVIYNVWVADTNLIQWPSIADVFFLGFYPLMLVSLLLFLHTRVRRPRSRIGCLCADADHAQSGDIARASRCAGYI